jgi:hypothetical protein
LTILIIDYRTALILCITGSHLEEKFNKGWLVGGLEVGEEIVPRPLASVLLTGAQKAKGEKQ